MIADWTGRNRVDLTLTHDDAVVLADVLRRWRDDGTLDRLPFEDGAEPVLIADLLGAIESVVDEATVENYLPAVLEARERVLARGQVDDAPAWSAAKTTSGDPSHV